jgi:hypothetical protein
VACPGPRFSRCVGLRGECLGHPLVVLADEAGADLVVASGAVVCERTASRGDFLAATRAYEARIRRATSV